VDTYLVRISWREKRCNKILRDPLSGGGQFQRRRIPERAERTKERGKSMEVSEKRDEKRRDGRQSDREWPAGIS